jgi:hypothetical protein
MAKKTDAATFKATFKKLYDLLRPYEKHFDVVRDKPGAYYLASRTAKTRSGAAIWFGGVEIKKNYVSFHLIPVYASPKLEGELSPGLKKRKQGKGCFNFTDISPDHLEELAAVTDKGFVGFAGMVKKFS